MSDKELSDYIKTIDTKFNSNLEKGTIEMANEYYNLLEEYIARLNNKKDLYKGMLDKIKEKINKELKEGRSTEEGKPEEYLWLMGYYDACKDLNELLEEIE